MSIENIDKLFKPDSIAIIGASDREDSISSAIFRNLTYGGYPGEVFPVNPKHKKVWGKQSYPLISKIRKPVDLALIAAPISTAPKIVSDCVKAETGSAIIISAGGKETGDKGLEIEAAIKNEAAGSNLRIVGPNCLGIICARSKLNASFASHMPISGKMAFVSQSGAICTSILDLSIKENIGFSYFVSLGSMLDIEFGDMVDYLGDDPDVSSIIMYVESLSRFRNFMSAARAVSRIKPIIVLKAGRSMAGAKAAASHTGSLAGENEVYDAAFKRAGIVRVKTFEELFDCAELLAKQPRPSSSGLAIVTNAGGPGVMATDALSDYGVTPVELSNETTEKLNAILPEHWSRGNPIDLIGDATPERYRQVAEICLNAPEVNGLLVMLSPTALSSPSSVAGALTELLKRKRIPIFTTWLGGAYVENGKKIFNQAGIPTFDTPERAVSAFMDLYHYSKNIEMLQEIPSSLPQKIEYDYEKAKCIIYENIEKENFILTETAAKEILTAYGIPVNRIEFASSEEEAVEKARLLGNHVAMKICSPDILHKTDANGVKLNLENEFKVRRAYNELKINASIYKPEARIEGVTIQPMIELPDYELIMGVKKDRDFGPVILFGLGGIHTEVIKDRAIALPPLNRLLARRLMEETKVYKILNGYRNRLPANLELLEEILIRLSQLVSDFPEIEEMDINPFFVKENTVCAVDARIILKRSTVKAPMHLVISPYPNRYESYVTCKSGEKLFVRPIRPEDAGLLTDLFSHLSPQTIYLRFFSPLKRLPHQMLARFTQIDYDREIALVALNETHGVENMVGVARVTASVDPQKAEFAILLEDNWQGKGIGAGLLKQCLDISRERGVEKVCGMVLAENTHMLALGKKLGFKMKRSVDAGCYDLEIDLTKPS